MPKINLHFNNKKFSGPNLHFSKLCKPPSVPEKKGVLICMKILRILGTIFTIILGTLAMLIFRSVFWMLKTWNNLSMEELIFHLKAPLEGTNEGMIWNYITSCLIISLMTMIVLILVFIFLRKKKLAHHITVLLILTVSTLTIFLSLRHVWYTLDITTYSTNHSTYSTFIDDNYVNPKDVKLTFPEKKRNLIYIYLESMENTYADKINGGGFDENVIPELTKLSMKNENFSGDKEMLNGGVSLTGTGWTVAAMFGQTSGLPLLIPIEQNSMNTQEHFFPGITTLGDILESAGYNQTLLIGSEAEFGGRKLYFTEHGNYSIQDYNYYLETGAIPSDYRVWWGFEDNKLFDFAQKKLIEAGSSDEPFNLTLLTVDTHFEDGYPCDDCPDTFGDNQYANVMACSSKKINDFVYWIQQQDFYENTTIVISGDHPTMDSDFCDRVDPHYTRKVYTTYINSVAEVENSSYREYSTLDNFPTTLASLGVKIAGERLGLGTNLFSNAQTLIERYGADTVNSELSKKSALMEKLTTDILSENNLNITEQHKEPEPEPEPPHITADISVSPYDYRTGRFEIEIRNVISDHEIQSIRCAVWASEDQSDLQWYEAVLQKDGTYLTKVMARDFGFAQATYNIHVYGLNASEEPEIIGMTTGEIVG